MSTDAVITTLVLVVAFATLVWDRVAPSAVVMGATLALLLADVIDNQQAFAGFSNAAPITVAALYVVAAAAQRTRLLSALVGHLLGTGTDTTNLTRLLVPTAAASALFNNTPLVAILMPDIVAWARRTGRSVSRYLLPLSYATILGGTITVLGTSTNLLVSGLVQERGDDALGVFEVAKVGLPTAVVGLVVLLTLSQRMIPERRSAPDTVGDEIREFTIEMRVSPGAAIAGLSVEDAGLRHLDGVYLVAIVHNGVALSPVSPTEIIDEGDYLVFAGQIDNVLDLQHTRGLEPAELEHISDLMQPRAELVEVVVGRVSPVAGQTLRTSDFRARYDAAVLAIHRAGQRIDSKLGDVRLRHGDTLVMLAGPDFRQRWGAHRDFLMVAPLAAPPPVAEAGAAVVAASLVGFVVLSATGVVSIVEGALLAAAAVVATGVLTFSDAKRAVDLDVILLIGASFGLGAAVETSGLANDIATSFTDAFSGLGTVGIVFGVTLATMLVTELVTNNAAAVVIFPIAISIAQASEIDPRLMAIAVAIAASCSFLSPIGYQTNTMVYGPGGYRFSDYLRAGFPLTIAVLVTAPIMVALLN